VVPERDMEQVALEIMVLEVMVVIEVIILSFFCFLELGML